MTNSKERRMMTKRNNAIEKSLEVDVDDASLEELEAAEEILDRASNARRVWIWALTILVAFVLVGCGGTPSSPSAAVAPSTETLTASVVAVLNIEVIEQNSSFWRFSWRVRVNASSAGECFLRTKYLDASGVELHEGIETIQVLRGDSTHTGQDLVDRALGPRVATLEARISSCLQ